MYCKKEKKEKKKKKKKKKNYILETKLEMSLNITLWACTWMHDRFIYLYYDLKIFISMTRLLLLRNLGLTDLMKHLKVK